MKYDVVITPESFHRFGQHNMEHIYPPMVIGDRSHDIAMEIVNGVDRIIKAHFNASVEELEGEDCDVLYRKYTLEKEGKRGIVHVKLRKITENCPPVDGNRCSVLEFERDIECIIKAIEECLA